jgi:allophanate hydrolase subunit 2
MDLIGQMQPNHRARFVAVSMEQTLAARRVANERLARLRKALGY